MTKPLNQQDSKADVEAVLAEFDSKKDLLATCSERTKMLLDVFLRDAKIRYQSIQHRVKDREKLRTKYLDPKKDYKNLNHITDQIALRVITYYEDEVDRVAQVLNREFEVDRTNSVDKREMEPNKFGYWALNYICKYGSIRSGQTEYKQFDGLWFEIQITSVLRHAWSEIEHPWYDLKDAFPDNIKRRFARMAALLEIAESEFLTLRNLQSDYTRSVAVQVEAKVPDLPVDEVSLRAFIATDSLMLALDQAIASDWRVRINPDLPDAMVQSAARAASAAGIASLQELRSSLEKYSDIIVQYGGRLHREAFPQSSPNMVIYAGTCLYFLFQILSNLQGPEITKKYFERAQLKPIWPIDRQVAVVKELLPEGSRK